MSDQVGLHLEYCSFWEFFQESLHLQHPSQKHTHIPDMTLLGLMIKGRMQSLAGKFILLNVVVCRVLTLARESVQGEGRIEIKESVLKLNLNTKRK